MSSNVPSQEQRQRQSRVIKSADAAAMRFAFPTLALDGGAAAAATAPADAAGTRLPAGGASAPPSQAAPSRAMQEAEARTRALERRAAAILAEAEDAAASRINDAERQAEALVAQAKADAEQIREDARRAGVKTGYDMGYQNGQRNGMEEAEALVAAGRAEAESLVAEANAAAESLHRGALEERERLIDSTKEQLLDLALAMARQVLKAELTLAPQAMLPMLEAAIIKLKGEEEPQVRVSPVVLAALEEQRGRLVAAAVGAKRIVMEADPGLEPGDFVVQGSQGFVDGRIDRQIQVLASEIRSPQEER